MNQDVQTTDSPTFGTLTLANVIQDNAQTKLLVLDSVTDTIEYRDVSSLPSGGTGIPPTYGKQRSNVITSVATIVTGTWVQITMGNTWGTGSFNGFTGATDGTLTKNATAGPANTLFKFMCNVSLVGTTGSARSYDFALFKNGVFLDDVGTIMGIDTRSSGINVGVTLGGTFTTDLVNTDAIDVRVRCVSAASAVQVNNIALTIWQ